ncbi:MAG: hypothetical protein APF81_19740 [Desulfosporosinus sp. BRH_c37]|nr:MAG: hypothetical protein APF81_19740 [Desulfosporosinus sp. BRH_c37]
MANLYLAYGSNMNLKQMEVRCPTAKVVGKATLKGYELLFKGVNGGAYATIKKNPDKETPVVVWEIDAIAENRLDKYEGFPTLYGKSNLRVELDGKKVSAMVYIMNRGPRLGMPEHHYYEGILAGYEAAGFDPAILEDALDASNPDPE